MHRTIKKSLWCKPILVFSFGQDLSWACKLGQAEQNRFTHPPHPTPPHHKLLKGSMHSRSPRFGMLASYRITNYTTKLTFSHHPQEGDPHPKDGHPTSKIYQKEVCNRLGIWHLKLTRKIKTSPSWTLKLSFSLFFYLQWYSKTSSR